AASRIDENAYLSALELLRDCIPAAGETDYRNWEWGRMLYLCQQATDVLATDSALETIAASKSGDGLGLIAVAGDSGTATIWAHDTGVKRTVDAQVNHIHCIAFSPDRRLLAIGTDTPGKFIQLIDLESGRISSVSDNAKDAHRQAVLSVEFSPDGKRLLSASRSGKIKIWDLQSRRTTATLHRHRSAVQQAKFFPTPDGGSPTKLISVSHDGSAIVWRDPTGQWSSESIVQEQGIFREHRGPVFAVAVTEDGQTIATAGHSGEILIWSDADLQEVDLVDLIERGDGQRGTTQVRRLIGHTAAVRSLDFAQSGDLLVSAGHDNTVRVWDAGKQNLIKVLRGHGRWVRGCVVSNDGRRVVSAGYDGAARLWDIEGYEELRVLRGKVLNGHDDGIMSAEFSPDSRRIVTASRDRTVRTWDFETGETIRRFREGHKFLASDAIPFDDGKLLASVAGDESVRIWDIESGAEIRTLSGTGQSAALDVSADGRFVLTAGPLDADRARQTQSEATLTPWSARLWDAQSGREIHQLFGHRAIVSAVAISPDSKWLYTGDINGTGVIWDRATGKRIKQLPWHQSKVLRARFSADGKRLITASFERGVATWDVSTWTVDRKRILMHPRDLVAVDISRDGINVVTSCEDNQIRVWNALQTKLVRSLDLDGESKNTSVDHVSISPNGRSIVVLNRQSGIARMFDVATGQEMKFRRSRGRRGGLLESDDGTRLSAVVFADDAHVVSIGGDQIRLWGTSPSQPQYRRLRMNFSPHDGVASASYSSDASEIVSGSWDGTANIWNAETGVVRTKLVGRHAGSVHCATFSPDPNSRMVATASADRTIVIWDRLTGKFVKRLMGHEEAVNWIAFDPDGRRLVSASNDRTARIWDVQSGETLFTFQHDSEVLRALFSPDGTRVASSTIGNLARIWSATDASAQATPLLELSGHTAPVTSIAFSSDGERAITGSEDFTAKVWDVTERGPKELVALTGHERSVTSVAFSPDRLNILTASEDGTAIIWMAGSWQRTNRDELRLTKYANRASSVLVSTHLNSPSLGSVERGEGPYDHLDVE
ncbi:MAG: hypothetical protein AAGC97_13180, partial [Planctomycetota bacterium]